MNIESLILCGGEGLRMMPWSAKRPKPLFGTGMIGETLLRRHLTMLLECGVEKIHVNVPTRWESIFVRESEHAEVPCQIWTEDNPIGSGSALRRVASKIADSDTILIVVCGDLFFDRAVFKEFIDALSVMPKDAAGMIGVHTISALEPRRGSVFLTSDNLLLRIVESGSQDTQLIRSGLDAYRVGSLRDIPYPTTDIGHDLLPALIKSKIGACILQADAPSPVDCGDLSRYVSLVASRYLEQFGFACPQCNDIDAEPITVVLRASRIYTAGNGGSLAVAMHAAQDWMKCGSIDARTLADPCMLTAFANDMGYENSLFSQIRGHIKSGDVLVCYSVSGTSRNIINVLNHVKQTEALSILVTSHDYSAIPPADYVVRAPFYSDQVQECEDYFGSWSHAIARVMQGLSPCQS